MSDLPHQKLRDKVIGGSEVGALFDANPYLSLHKLFHIKSGNITDFDENVATKRGKYFEDGVARWAADELGGFVWSPNVFLTRKDMPGLGGTPDRYINIKGDEGVLECKTMNQWAAERWENREVPPLYYAMQTELYVHLKKANFGYLAIYVMGEERPPYLFHIQPNEETRILMTKGADAFWRMVSEGNEPPPAASDYEDIVARKNGLKPKRQFADLSGNNYIVHLCDSYVSNREQINALEKEQERIKAEVTNATLKQSASNFNAGAFQGIFSERSGTPDKIITPEMVGQTIKGRAGSTSLTIKRRKQ